jgi:uncharacterized membrane protein YecN with MAPEG domain
MQDTTGFRREQRAVALGMGLAMLLTLAALAIGFGQAWGPAAPFAARLTLGLKSGLFALVWLVAGIGNIARLRFFSAQDIAGAGSTTASEAVKSARAILQNTLEQVALAVPLYLALAALLPRPWPLLPMLAALFCLGRALFWAGYARGAGARSFGFALTFYPSVLALLAAILLALFAIAP